MSNISVKINLRQLKHTMRTMKGVSGDIECLIIPISANSLVKGEKGVYIDMTGFELKEKKGERKDTHLIKQNFPKEIFDAMTDDEKKSTPILGNMVVWGYQEPAPNNMEIPTFEDAGAADLPF